MTNMTAMIAHTMTQVIVILTMNQVKTRHNTEVMIMIPRKQAMKKADELKEPIQK